MSWGPEGCRPPGKADPDLHALTARLAARLLTPARF
jgi:hypothetical protein